MDGHDELERPERLLWELHKLGGPKPTGMSAEEKVQRYRELLNIPPPAHSGDAAYPSDAP